MPMRQGFRDICVCSDYCHLHRFKSEPIPACMFKGGFYGVEVVFPVGMSLTLGFRPNSSRQVEPSLSEMWPGTQALLDSWFSKNIEDRTR